VALRWAAAEISVNFRTEHRANKASAIVVDEPWLRKGDEPASTLAPWASAAAGILYLLGATRWPLKCGAQPLQCLEAHESPTAHGPWASDLFVASLVHREVVPLVYAMLRDRSVNAVQGALQPPHDVCAP